PPEMIFTWAGNRTPQTVLDTVRAEMDASGDTDKGIVISEVGFLCGQEGQTPGTDEYGYMDEAHRDRFVVRNILHAMARNCQGYHAMFNRDLTNNQKGWYNADYSPRDLVTGPIELMLGTLFTEATTYVERLSLGSGYLWGHKFTSGGRSVIACWTQNTEFYNSDHDICSVTSTDISIPVDVATVTVYQQDGSHGDVIASGGNITLDLVNDVQFVVWSAGEIGSVPVPPAALTLPSLRIGSDALGWQEFGDVAQFGTMTKAMPGGDGSLDFTLAGTDAGKQRNVLTAGAECVLTLPSGGGWSGLLVGDPVAGFYSARPLVSVAAAGLWSHAANRRDVARVWADSDPAQWVRIKQKWSVGDGFEGLIDQGLFTTDTEGRLWIHAHRNRAYSAKARGCYTYWLDQGLVDMGYHIVGFDPSYKSQFAGLWRVALLTKDGTPWDCAYDYSDPEFEDTTERTSWYAPTVDLAAPATSLVFMLQWDGTAETTPTEDRWLNVRSVTVYCRMDGANVDRAVTLDKAICDLAQMDGLATVIRSETLGSARTALALRPDSERSIADGIRELAALHPVALEHFFDRADGAWRFTVNELPSSVDPTRNRHWILDD
ncbi:MAG: hypothetical protein MUQ56_15050, partial [Thermoleophilia bacterium]|nr:hypothetical protein [Thermoleophilia bacterium]